MESIRKWFYRPKKDDTSLLAQFYCADESLLTVACELDSFDGRQEPERCSTLVNQLRHCQDRVLTLCSQIMDDLIPESRANRDFRVKFPDDVMQENLAGHLWFGAECLAAGSSIMNREAESSAMRPLAKALTKSLDIVRKLLSEHALKGNMNLKYLVQTQNPLDPSLEKLIESLKIFDRLFADFELCYVSAMVPVKSTKEYEHQELVCVLFSETLQRALESGLLSQADVDNYEPALMFTIPRLAIVAGLLAPPGGPLCLDSPDNISEMFRPFRTLLLKIRELLWTLNNRELHILEKLLCSNEEPSIPITQPSNSSDRQDVPDLEEFVHNFYTGYPNCKDFIVDFYTVTRNTGNNMDEVAKDVVHTLDEDQGDSETRGPTLLDEGRGECDGSDRSSSRDSEEVRYRGERSASLEDSSRSPDQIPLSVRDSSREEMAQRTGVVDEMHAGSPVSKQQEEFITSDITEILGSTNNIEIPQTQYLLNQVSHESNVTVDTAHIQDSLPDLDSRKLISEANKTLSHLLLDGESQNEISEQTDSGICTVISSENTSLYDKSPEEKKTFAGEMQRDGGTPLKVQRNICHACSNLSSPRKSANVSDDSCVCGLKSTKASLDRAIGVRGLPAASPDASKNAARISSNFDGTNEEFVGMAYGAGQISVCDSNQSGFQINYTENWENLNLSIDATTTRNEFWNDLKGENCPSTSRSIEKVGTKIEQYAQNQIDASVRTTEEKQKRGQQTKQERTDQRTQHGPQEAREHHLRAVRTSPSTESSRSNSTDRCLNPRLVNYGASLHPSQNTRQMPNFGSRSPHDSPRLQHYKTRNIPVSTQGTCTVTTRPQRNLSPQNRKLLDHRRTRSEQISRMKRRGHDKTDRKPGQKKLKCRSRNVSRNDGLGPRTNKSGLAAEPTTPGVPHAVPFEMEIDDNSQRETIPSNLIVNSIVFHGDPPIRSILTIGSETFNSILPSEQKSDIIESTPSCSSDCDSSSDTSEFQSDGQDDEEIALAMQAAEIANRNQIRAKFQSSEDLVHRLFVCIAGVADQLQTNFASDLRNILKCVFLMNSSQSTEVDEAKDECIAPTEQVPIPINDTTTNHDRQDSLPECGNGLEETAAPHAHPTASPVTENGEECVERAPAWVPDNDAPRCMACHAGFTVVRRRHHCRNCGKVFCGRCSSNSVPLPHYGHTKPVRVCNRCFLYQVTPFTVSQVTRAS